MTSKKVETKYRTVQEIMEEFGCNGKHDDPEYLKDVLIRIDCLWRQNKRLHDSQERRSDA